MDPPGVLCVLRGGLGNQCFVAAASLIVASYHSVPCYVYTNTNIDTRNHQKVHPNPYRLSIFKHFLIPIANTQPDSSCMHILRLKGYAQHLNTTCQLFEPWSVEDTKIPIIMDNYYQYWNVLEPYQDLVRTTFLKGLSEEYIHSPGLPSPSTSVFIHIRRGDYLKNPGIYPIPSIDYYRKGMQILEEAYPTETLTFYLFTDDLEWARAQPLFQTTPNVTISKETDEIYILWLMSLCKAGAIIANSSFSWWGAFLGASANSNARVIAPEVWMHGHTPSLFPSHWIPIPI